MQCLFSRVKLIGNYYQKKKTNKKTSGNFYIPALEHCWQVCSLPVRKTCHTTCWSCGYPGFLMERYLFSATIYRILKGNRHLLSIVRSVCFFLMTWLQSTMKGLRLIGTEAKKKAPKLPSQVSIGSYISSTYPWVSFLNCS